MKRISMILVLCCFVICLSVFSSSAAQDNIPKVKLPVLTTSAGQSADVNTLNVIMEQAGVGYDYCDIPTVEMMEDGVVRRDLKRMNKRSTISELYLMSLFPMDWNNRLEKKYYPMV